MIDKERISILAWHNAKEELPKKRGTYLLQIQNIEEDGDSIFFRGDDDMFRFTIKHQIVELLDEDDFKAIETMSQANDYMYWAEMPYAPIH